MTPPPTDFHQEVGRRLFLQLCRQAPAEWEPVYEVAFRIGTDGRVPDLAVVRAGLPVRPREVAYQPQDFALLIEVVSPTSTGMDLVLKPSEYAASGVPFFWRVETEPTVEIVAYELVAGQYREAARLSEGTGELPGPYPMLVDVTALSQPWHLRPQVVRGASHRPDESGNSADMADAREQHEQHAGDAAWW